MVGQENNKKLIDDFVENNTCPRFIIITGTEGSGKRTFSKYIADRLGAEFLLFDNKIDSVREVITTAYTQTKNIVYCIYGYETMSIASKNALLKIAEEPPTNTYVILTATNKNDILDTLKSRAVVIDMEFYSHKELQECAKLFGVEKDILTLCQVPQDILKLQDINEEEFKKFVDNVWDNIGNASIGNSLKIGSKLKLKDEQDGYDVILFINALMKKIIETFIEHNKDKKSIQCGLNMLSLCFETKNKFVSKYNKQAIIDTFIIRMRGLRNGII